MQSSKLLTSNDIANYLKISLVTGCQIYSGNRFAFWMYLLTDKRICCKILHFSQDTCKICSGNKLALFYNVSFHNNTTRSVEIHAMQPLQRFALVSCHWLPYIFWEQVCIVLVLNNIGCRETNVQCTKTCKNVQKYAPHSGAGRWCLVAGCQICCAIRFTTFYSRISWIICENFAQNA